jgi:hypothetical protein
VLLKRCAFEAAESGSLYVIRIEGIGVHQRLAGRVEGKRRRLVVIGKKVRDYRLDALPCGGERLLVLVVIAGQPAQLAVPLRQVAIGLGLAQASDQVHHPWVFVVSFAGVVGFDGLEPRDVLGADQAGLVAQATGGLEELFLVSSSRLGQDVETVQASFLGHPF